MADSDKEPHYASDRIAITRVLEMERYHRDRREWDEQRACYTDDCRIEMGWFQGNADEFVEESRRQVERVKKTTAAFHYFWPKSVRIEGDRAVAESQTQVVVRTLIDGLEIDLTCMGRMVSRVQRLGGEGRWRIASLHWIYVKDSVAAALPWQTVPIRPEELDGRNPSYRMNSWLLGKLGYPCDQHRLGEDRPEQVAAFNRAADEWLSATE